MGLSGAAMQQKEHYSTFECEDGLHLNNLPSLTCGNHHGNKNGTGMGVQLEVYKDKVVIRPKDFRTSAFVKSIAIKNGKPYYEAEIL